MVSSWRISHLGINPVRGGRPPRERRMKGAKRVRTGIFVCEVASALIFVVLLSLKSKKIEEVMTM